MNLRATCGTLFLSLVVSFAGNPVDAARRDQTPNGILQALLNPTSSAAQSDANGDGRLDGGDLVKVLLDPAVREFSEEVRLANLFAVEDFANGPEISNATPEEATTAMVDLFRTLPGVVEVFIADGGQTATALFVDGTTHTINNSFTWSGPDTVPRAVKPHPEERQTAADLRYDPTISEMPASNRAFVFNNLGSNWPNDAIAPEIAADLEAIGYEVNVADATIPPAPGLGIDAQADLVNFRGSVDSLRLVSNAGLIVVVGHGSSPGATLTGNPLFQGRFSLGTSTLVTKPNGPALARYLASDIRANRVHTETGVFGYEIINGRYRKVYATYYCITNEFMRHYWSLADGAMVLLAACNSDNFLLQQALLDGETPAGNGGVVIGWNGLIGSTTAFPAIRHIVGRLTGSDTYNAPWDDRDFPVRPFSLDVILDEMGRRSNNPGPNLLTDEKGTKLVEYRGRPDPFLGPSDLEERRFRVGTLRPVIRTAIVDGGQQLLGIAGRFNEEFGQDDRVTLDGQDLVILREFSTSDFLVAELPTNSHGPIVATVNGIESVSLPLVQYTGTIEIRTLLSDYPPEIAPDEEVRGSMELSFRAVPYRYRLLPDREPNFLEEHRENNDAAIPGDDLDIVSELKSFGSASSPDPSSRVTYTRTGANGIGVNTTTGEICLSLWQGSTRTLNASRGNFPANPPFDLNGLDKNEFWAPITILSEGESALFRIDVPMFGVGNLANQCTGENQVDTLGIITTFDVHYVADRLDIPFSGIDLPAGTSSYPQTFGFFFPMIMPNPESRFDWDAFSAQGKPGLGEIVYY